MLSLKRNHIDNYGALLLAKAFKMNTVILISIRISIFSLSLISR